MSFFVIHSVFHVELKANDYYILPLGVVLNALIDIEKAAVLALFSYS